MARATLPPHEVAALSLADEGAARIAWAAGQMPVLAQIRERFERERPLDEIRVGACLHVTAETASLLLTLMAGGAVTVLCSANPLSVQDDVAAALVKTHGVEVRATRGEGLDTYAAHVRAALETRPEITIDDGADLLVTAHELGGDDLAGLIGGTEETTTGLVRLRRLEHEQKLSCPVLALNEARTERALNDRHGTGPSALEGILLANAGHFAVELDLDELRDLATAPPTEVRPLVEQYELKDGRRLNLLAWGRVVNLAAAEGHPAAVMDVSFALQALCVEELVRRGREMAPGVHQVPGAIDDEVARLKLAALGVRIDEPTPEQEHYRESWA